VQTVEKEWEVDHEQFSIRTMDNDITLVRLKTPLTFNNYVQPVCLPTAPVAVGTKCVVTGWGDTTGRQRRNCYMFRSLSVINT